MSRLAAQQQALLDALLLWPPDDAIKILATHADLTSARGLKAYQTNGHALAQRALAAAYPVLEQLLGPESLRALALAFWHARPPEKGDLAEWGDGLPEFVRASTQLAELPYLADVARVEWALHRCATAADQSFDAASFTQLTQHDPGQLRLRLAPGCAVVTSAQPVSSIVAAHRHGTPELAAVGRLLQAGVAESALVWRQGWLAQLTTCSAPEAAFVQALLGGASLLAALDAPGLATTFDFSAWLTDAVQNRVLLGIEVIGLTQNCSG